jgi:hypothetical protein
MIEKIFKYIDSLMLKETSINNLINNVLNKFFVDNEVLAGGGCPTRVISNVCSDTCGHCGWEKCEHWILCRNCDTIDPLNCSLCSPWLACDIAGCYTC